MTFEQFAKQTQKDLEAFNRFWLESREKHPEQHSRRDTEL